MKTKKQKIKIEITVNAEVNVHGANKLKDFVKPVVFGNNPAIFELTIDGSIVDSKYSVYTREK